MYQILSKIYYKDNANYNYELDIRLKSYGTTYLPFKIKPIKSRNEFQCFIVNYQELDYLHYQITMNTKKILDFIHSKDIPGIAINNYIKSKLIDELLSTNTIEGVRSTKAELEYALEQVEKISSTKKSKVKHESLMKTYYNLMRDKSIPLATANDIRAIYDELVKDEINADDALDGKLFRSQPVDVKTETGKLLHRSILNEENIISQINSMLDFISHFKLPMLYKIAVSHYIFGYIHPFYDGNGRTSRFISSMLLKDELDILTALTLSYSTHLSQSKYYDAFNVSNDPLNHGDLTYFCNIFFEIIHQAQIHVLDELSMNKFKMNKLIKLIQSLNIDHQLYQDVLFIIGQSYIFGLKDKGISKTELIDCKETSDYLMKKALTHLQKQDYIKLISKNPIVVTLSDSLQHQLEALE